MDEARRIIERLERITNPTILDVHAKPVAFVGLTQRRTVQSRGSDRSVSGPRAAYGGAFEAADHAMDYSRWRVEHLFLLVPAQQYVGQFLSTFKEFPPRQKTGSFSLDAVLNSLQQSAKN